jgi:hypothetical protein
MTAESHQTVVRNHSVFNKKELTMFQRSSGGRILRSAAMAFALASFPLLARGQVALYSLNGSDSGASVLRLPPSATSITTASMTC